MSSCAEVVELVDTLDLGSSASRRESSSLSFRTIWGIAKLVRQRVLIPPFVGSSPATPAILFESASVYAEVVELVDTLDLGSSASRRESSSLSFRTIWGIAKLVRQRVLIPPFVGSSPATPAIF